MENNKSNTWNQLSTISRVRFAYQRSISIVFFLLLLLTVNVHADQCLDASNPIVGQVYHDGDVVDCYVTSELAVGPTVTAESGAMLLLSAPSVVFNGPLTIQKGAILSVNSTLGGPNQAVLGPLAGAEIKAFRLTDLSNSVETQTAMGLIDMDFAGRFHLSLDGIPDNEWVLVSATGGVDIDADDDGVLDASPTPNLGTIYGLAKAVDWRGGGLFVSALTDMVWRYTKNLVDKVPPADLGIRIDDLVKQLVQSDLDGDTLLDLNDIYHFDPANPVHQAALNFDYQRFFTHNAEGDFIVQALHQGNETLLESLLDAEFGHTLTRAPLPDSRYSSVRVDLVLAGQGSATAPSDVLLVDSELDPVEQTPYAFFPKDVTQSLVITAVPKPDTEITGWAGCDTVSVDKTQCAFSLGNNRDVVAMFTYSSGGGGNPVYDLSTGNNVLYPDVINVTTDAGDTELITVLSQLQSGDYIVGSTGDGFLRKVIEIYEVDSLHYILHTIDASLDEVVGQGTALLRRPLTNADLVGYQAPTNIQGPMVATAAFSGLPGLQLVPSADPTDTVFHLQFGSTGGESNSLETQKGLTAKTQEVLTAEVTIIETPTGKITASGTLDYELDLDFAASFCGFRCLEHWHFLVNSTATQELSLTVTGIIAKVEKKKKLGTLNFGKIAFVIGVVPVWVTPKVDLYVGVSGAIEAEWTSAVEFSQNLNAGIIYNQVSGFDGVKDFDFGFDVDPLEIALIGKMRIPFVETMPILKIYDATGPALPLTAYFELRAEISKEWNSGGCDGVLQVSTLIGLESEFYWDLSGDTKIGRTLHLDELEDKSNFKIRAGEWPLTTWYPDLPCTAFPYLHVDGPPVITNIVEGSSGLLEATYVLENQGGVELPWRVDYINDPYISVVPDNGNLAGGAFTTVFVSIDPSSFGPGHYRNPLTLVNAYDESQPDSKTGTTQEDIDINVLANLIVAPVLGSATYTGPGRAHLTWSFDPASSPVPLDGYQIHVSFDGGASWQPNLSVMNINTQSTDVTGLPLGTVHFLLDAYAGNTRTPVSNSQSVNILVTGTPPTTGSKLNDTGITWGGNYPSGNNATCTGETIAAQDCSHGRDATHNDDFDGHAGFSFTKLDANGNPLPRSASTWSCVKDNVTGLVWEVKTDDGGLQDTDNTYTWYNPDPNTNGGNVGTVNGGVCTGSECDTNAYVQAINTLPQALCGTRDWRMPQIAELRSIVDHSLVDPAIDAQFFPNQPSLCAWSASPEVYSVERVWVLCFEFGNDSTMNRVDDLYTPFQVSFLRLVSGGQ